MSADSAARSWPAVLIVAAILLVYVSSLGNGFIAWDDDSLVYENPLVMSLSPETVKGAWTSYDPELYIPLTILTYQLENRAFGSDPFWYHLTNVLLHALNAVLAWALLRRWIASGWAAIAGALIFALHPLNTEAVAWISARKDLLASAFFLFSLLGYLRFRQTEGRRTYVLSVLSFLFALLSKVSVLTLPLVLILVDWREGRNMRDRRVWIEKIPYALLSIIFLIIALLGKTTNIRSLETGETLLLAAKSMAAALTRFVAPVNLSIAYHQSDPVTITDASFLLSVLAVLAIGAWSVWSLRGTKLVAFAAAFWLLAFLPSFATFSKSGGIFYTSDRYAYLPMIGMLVIIASALERLFRAPRPGWMRTGAATMAAFVVIVSGWTARARSLEWIDSETIFLDALATSPDTPVIHVSLGAIAYNRGDAAQARASNERALALDPAYVPALNNLAALDIEESKLSDARGRLERAIVLDPESVQAHLNLGLLQEREGKPAESEASYRRVLALNRRDPIAWNNLCALFVNVGRVDEAITACEQAVQLQPGYIQAWSNLGSALGKAERYEEALRAFLRATELDPAKREQADALREELQKGAR